MKKFDLQDALLLVGIASIVGGVAVWSRPAAAIVFGCFCLLFVAAISRARQLRRRAVAESERKS